MEKSENEKTDKTEEENEERLRSPLKWKQEKQGEGEHSTRIVKNSKRKNKGIQPLRFGEV